MRSPFVRSMTAPTQRSISSASSSSSPQTSFMITHDIDEAILLSDRIVLMTNGPEARVCEIVENSLPKSRTRSNMHTHPNYYPMRNHLIEFLVNRSKSFREELASASYDPKNPPVARPAAEGETPNKVAS